MNNKKRDPQDTSLYNYASKSKQYSAAEAVRNKQRFSVILFALAFIVLIIVGIIGASQEDTYKTRYHSLNSRLDSEQLRNSRLAKEEMKPKYVITATGKMDYASAATIKKIKQLFSVCNNWKSGHQYAVARQRAARYVKDRSFFKGHNYMWPRVDSSGDSTIDALGIKRMNNGTNVYELSPGKFLVITSYYDYFKSEEMTQKGSMTTSDHAFIFYGHQQSIDKVQPLKNLDLDD